MPRGQNVLAGRPILNQIKNKIGDFMQRIFYARRRSAESGFARGGPGNGLFGLGSICILAQVALAPPRGGGDSVRIEKRTLRAAASRLARSSIARNSRLTSGSSGRSKAPGSGFGISLGSCPHCGLLLERICAFRCVSTPEMLPLEAL